MIKILILGMIACMSSAAMISTSDQWDGPINPILVSEIVGLKRQLDIPSVKYHENMGSESDWNQLDTRQFAGSDYYGPVVERMVRQRRSPQNIGLSGGSDGHGGYLRGTVDVPVWQSRDGRHQLGADAYYQRNFNMPGPRQDYGGNVRYSFSF